MKGNQSADPFARYVCQKMAAENAPGIESRRRDVTVIGEPGVDGAYIASSLTFADYGIPTR